MLPADSVYINGTVVTVDANNTISEAVAVKYGKISKVGTTTEIKRLVGDKTVVIDLKGRSLLPGFIDPHLHVKLSSLNLFYRVPIFSPPLKYVSEVLEKIERKVRETSKGEWVQGAGSHYEDQKLVEKRYPTKAELDRVAPDNPVVLRFGGHVQMVNSRALESAKITKDTPDPPGGKIEKDPLTREPTGLVRECWSILHVPEPTPSQTRECVKKFAKMFLSRGVTTVGDIPESINEMDFYRDMVEKGEFPLRYHAFPNVSEDMADLDSIIELGLHSMFGNEWFMFDGIKLFADGGLTGPSAALHEPYAFRPDFSGILKMPPERLTEFIVKAHKAGLRVIVHAAGDRGEDVTIDAIETALKEMPREDHRHRIEHMGHILVTPERIERIKKLGIIPVPTPMFLYTLGDSLEYFLGHEKAKKVFVTKSMMDRGIVVPSCSDSAGSEAVQGEPFVSMWSAVARKTLGGKVLNPEERITVMDAIRMHTINAAYALFDEKIKGSIESGKLADLIVLSDNPLTVPIDDIPKLKVEMTIIGGKTVYSAS